MTSWVAVSYGALDISDIDTAVDADVRYMVMPVRPVSEPTGLGGEAGTLWRRLVQGPVADADLTHDQRSLIMEFEEFGIASSNLDHPAKLTELLKPWLSSPLHELVYSLVASIARDAKITVVFIKGPVLRRQGLREREHSGDVDVWVHPDQIGDLAKSLAPWGWQVFRDIWQGTQVHHSVTLKPTVWGCEIDLHRRFPGIAISDIDAFSTINRDSTQILFAGVRALVPSFLNSALISALHSMRPSVDAANGTVNCEDATRVLAHAGDGVVAAAEKLGANAVLQEPLQSAFATYRHDSSHLLPQGWVWRTQKTRALAYLTLLKTASWRDRSILIVRFIWPPQEAIAEYEHLTDAGTVAFTILRFKRLKRGIIKLLQSRR